MKQLTKLVLLALAGVLLNIELGTWNCFAQITFQKTYGGAAEDIGNCVKQTSDCGYIIVGQTRNFGSGLRDLFLIRTDMKGDTLWTKIIGGANNDIGNSIQQTTDGGFIIAGYTMSYGAGAADVWLIKTDLSGNITWTKTYGGVGEETGWGVSANVIVQQTTDGGYIMTTYTKSFGAGLRDVYLIKTDATGTLSWTRTYGGVKDDLGTFVQQTTDGGYIICGYTESFGAGNRDVYLIKTDTIGTIIWTKTYGGGNQDEAYCVQQTADGGYIIQGCTFSYGIGMDDVWLIKTDSNGNITWNKTYGGTSNDGDFQGSVIQTKDGGYFVGSQTYTGAVNGYDVFLVKTDATGTLQWAKTLGGTNYDEGYFVQQTTDGGYIIIGEDTKGFGVGVEDIYLIKTDANGVSGCNEKSVTPTVTSPVPSVGSGGTTGTGGTAAIAVPAVKSGGIVNTQCSAGSSGGGGGNPAITPAGPFCQSAPPVNLTAASTGGTWSGTGITDAANGTFSPSVSGIGTFIIKYKLVGGCGIDSDTVAIVVNTTANVTITPVSPLCRSAAAVNLTAATSGGTWSGTGITNAANGTFTSSVAGAGNHVITYTITGSCPAMDTVTITVKPLPAITVSPNATLCAGDIATLTASGGGGPNYVWNNATTANSITAIAATSYTVTSSNGCTDSITVSFLLKPFANAANATICSGQNATLTAYGGVNYLWNTGSSTATTSSITVAPLSTVSYTVIVSTGSCPDTATATVVVNQNPVAAIQSYTTSTVGSNTTLVASTIPPGGGVTYLWIDNANAATDTITVNPASTTRYCVTIIDIVTGCADNECEIVFGGCSNTGELFLPNAFSPNGDGENDTLRIYYGNFLCIKDFRIAIYDRWGEIVFQSYDPAFKWEGTQRGKWLDPAVFAYYMNATFLDGTTIDRKGNISLVK